MLVCTKNPSINLLLITSLFFSFPFIFASLSKIRDFSKTQAYQDQNSSNFGYDLLTMFKTSGDYFDRLSNRVCLNSNSNLNLVSACPSLAILLSLFLFLFKLTKGVSPANLCKAQQEILTQIHPLSYLVGIEGKRRSPRPPYQNPSLSLFCFDHHCRRRPPMGECHPAGPLV
jgi:hypothetical protein